MKKIFITIILLLYPFNTYAGLCFDSYQIYTNKITLEEKYLYCAGIGKSLFGNFLNKFTEYPLNTTSYNQSRVATNCEQLNTNNEKLLFIDFSLFDQIKIIFNAIIIFIILFLPILLITRIKNKGKKTKIKELFIVLSFLLLVALFIIGLIYFGIFLGGCNINTF